MGYPGSNFVLSIVSQCSVHVYKSAMETKKLVKSYWLYLNMLHNSTMIYTKCVTYDSDHELHTFTHEFITSLNIGKAWGVTMDTITAENIARVNATIHTLFNNVTSQLDSGKLPSVNDLNLLIGFLNSINDTKACTQITQDISTMFTRILDDIENDRIKDYLKTMKKSKAKVKATD